ncbi:Hypothetical protein PFR_JS9-2_1745 [Propionibacterium freudenreichii]|uniref:Uncharacterized protein n=1 Tax=Propionibacterium freudenreichii TaxID=1744 RepID=A0A2C7YTV7_9ACTN|nr:Hypothetical protein RM25_0629 [Propionibacterium freudenreichii subsp. freudenreichii]SBM43720.1 Hypothetical protein PFR_JS2_1561 [Propionibacterium freudenreichii]SBN43392.1 Hypothetical protein PFR_J18_1054 [Propionibacterium freudenreichii]SBN52711.1 Hypothetical protein PFR_JS8_1645 [Propionibacterium freudenreichii]SCQ46590.1 Hypothetical protein PFR_JS7-1_1640 [Propionibacterium freudenreichii]
MAHRGANAALQPRQRFIGTNGTSLAGATDKTDAPAPLGGGVGASGPASGVGHSHSMVAGGLLVTSSTTRFTSGHWLVMRVLIFSSRS